MSEEYEELSEAEIAAMMNPAPAMYYVYFDDDGIIDAITNEQRINPTFNVVELEYNDVKEFFAGTFKIIDYKLSLVNKNKYIFVKNKADVDVGLNLLVGVNKPVDLDTTCIVKWNKQTRHWDFYLQEDTPRMSAFVSFYVTLSSNKNFILRTIKFDAKELASANTVSIPFISHLEDNIANVTVSTKKFFDSYGLIANE